MQPLQRSQKMDKPILLAESRTSETSMSQNGKPSKLKPLRIDFILQSVQAIESDTFALKTPHACLEHLSLRGDSLASDEEIYRLRSEPVVPPPEARSQEAAKAGKDANKIFVTLIEAGCEVVRGIARIRA